MIISSVLDANMEAKLLDVLQKNMDAFSWSIKDIKGISPSIFMHKIMMEEVYAPTIEHQRRLNPAMKEVMRKEVIKLLHAGFIYVISNSSWVNLMQVVLKKGGMTIVKNDKDEIISTRIVMGW